MSHHLGHGNSQSQLAESLIGSVNAHAHARHNLLHDIKVEDSRARHNDIIGARQAPPNCDSVAGVSLRNAYLQQGLANAVENGASSSLQRFASLVGMEIVQNERIENFLKYSYDTESEGDTALRTVKMEHPQGSAYGRKPKSKSRKRQAASTKMEASKDDPLRKYPCPECPLSFKTGYHLKRHHSTIHEDQRFPCTICHTSYGRREKLRAHLEIVHKIQSYFVCEICLVSYESKDLLQRHMYRHQHPKPLECGTCLTPSVRLSDGSCIGNHVCITYQDSYECCDKNFGYHYYYNRHMLLVHNLKTNARVKLPKDTLLSQFRAMRP